MSSGRSIKLLVSVLLAASLLAPVSDACGAGKGDWELSDDRKRWRYLYSYDEPARDEWIEYDGKEYYVDSKGYLKTGWVTDPYDDCKYYTGTDGAKRYNMFTPDDYYVGPDGTRLELFNTYRREIKKQLEKIMKDKAFKERDVADRPGFLLIDLNADRYQDLVVVNHAARPERVILAAVWDPEEKKLILAAEADPDGAELSEITFNPESQTAWLVITDRRENNQDFFCMDEGSIGFENVWHFTTETDEWDDLEYGINDDTVDADEWYLAIEQARTESGSAVAGPYLLLDESLIKQAVDRAPTTEELSLWEP